MLIEFRVENFRSFADEQCLSLVASTDRNHPLHIHEFPDGDKVLRTAAIYGKNASGKSNLIHAMACMRNFVEGSASRYNAGDPIEGIVPFRLDSKLESLPSKFSTTIAVGAHFYTYKFSATSQRVIDEVLIELPHTVLFERHYDEDEGQYKYNWVNLRDERIGDQTRDNALVLSVGAQLNNRTLTEVYRWFKDDFRVVDMSEASDRLLLQTATMVGGDAELRQSLLDLVADADFGIAGVEIKEEAFREATTRGKARPDVQRLLDAVRDAMKTIAPDQKSLSIQTVHWRDDAAGVPVFFNMRTDESKGTQRVFALGGSLLSAIRRGSLIVIDEFDCSIHPKLARGLIQYFHVVGMASRAQLILATHDATLFDESLFRRDQLWLVDKHDSGRSTVQSLHDYAQAPRSSAAFQRNFLRGEYGGVPALGPLLIDPGPIER